MRPTKRFWLTLAAIGVSASLNAHAQDTNQSSSSTTNRASSSSSDRWSDTESSRRHSWIPLTSYGYVGANAGVSSLNVPGCAPGASCEDSGNGFKAYTGGLFSRMFGVELSYVQFLGVDRNGGNVRAKGANLGLVGNLPLSDQFNVFGKVGVIYGWTKTDSSIPGVPSGGKNNLDWSYGAGAQFDVSREWGLRADWDVYRMEFAGGKSDASLFSVGAVYKF
jgi:OmpA-OmpF porin, OOP family